MKFQSSIVWEILYYISLKVQCSCIDLSTFDRLQNEVPYRIRYAIPFLASMATKIPLNYLSKLSNIIFSLCDPDKSDVDMRNIAALANNELAKVFPAIPDSVRITSIKSAVLLLQDEDEDVRIINVHFYLNIKKEGNMLQPFVCLTNILDKNFLGSCLDDPQTGIPYICEDLLEIIGSYAKSEDTDQYNPFSNDSKNIYFEAKIVKKLIQNVTGSSHDTYIHLYKKTVGIDRMIKQLHQCCS